MKKIVSATDLGGAPFFKNDMREVFNSEIWDVIDNLISGYAQGTYGIVVSGCVFSANGGNFDMTAGIVYLDGEFMRVSAVTNQSFTKYIAAKTPTSDSRTFANGSTNSLIETKEAELVSSIPMSGQYIPVSSLSSVSFRRLIPTEWTTFTLANGWTSVVGATAQYRYDRIRGVVELRGKIDASSSSSQIFANTGVLPGIKYTSFRSAIVRDDAVVGSLSANDATGWQISSGGGFYNTANTYDLVGQTYIFDGI